MVSRRHALLGLCAASIAAATARVRAGQPVLREVAPGVFFRRGVCEDASASNADAIANCGCIIGRSAVAVVDPGGSLIDGERLRAAIRALTPLPIRFVVITHGHPDHCFGTGAFAPDAPRIVGHRRLAAVLAARGAYYQRRLEQMLGRGRAGPIVLPTLEVADRTEIDLGGRPLALTAHPPAHSACDLSLLDRTTGTLVAGDLLFVERVPSLDGSLPGWLGVLKRLRGEAAVRAVPGHGPVSVCWPQGGAALERYLTTLLRETREALRRGLELEAAVGTVAQSERTRWKLFDDYNGHNVTEAYKELEWEPQRG